ncbi:MAG TPA: stage V sporulation protein AC [Firmicutes bacterium]|nr:stage V sporulation protein AC [Bacillota bacterium]
MANKLDEEQRKKDAYQRLVARKKPKPRGFRNFVVAFIVGGLICVVGQVVLSIFIARGMSQDQAAAPTLAVMIFIGALATGLGIYDYLGEFAGAGAAVPITGFSNTIVAAAMDFKREGYVLGMGAKMFLIAGPVLVFGIITAIFVGAIHLLTS